jgi:hypothetical protein
MPLPGPPLLSYPASIPLDQKLYSGMHRLDHARIRAAANAPSPPSTLTTGKILTKLRHSPSLTTARPE